MRLVYRFLSMVASAGVLSLSTAAAAQEMVSIDGGRLLLVRDHRVLELGPEGPEPKFEIRMRGTGLSAVPGHELLAVLEEGVHIALFDLDGQEQGFFTLPEAVQAFAAVSPESVLLSPAGSPHLYSYNFAGEMLSEHIGTSPIIRIATAGPGLWAVQRADSSILTFVSDSGETRGELGVDAPIETFAFDGHGEVLWIKYLRQPRLLAYDVRRGGERGFEINFRTVIEHDFPADSEVGLLVTETEGIIVDINDHRIVQLSNDGHVRRQFEYGSEPAAVPALRPASADAGVIPAPTETQAPPNLILQPGQLDLSPLHPAPDTILEGTLGIEIDWETTRAHDRETSRYQRLLEEQEASGKRAEEYAAQQAAELEKRRAAREKAFADEQKAQQDFKDMRAATEPARRAAAEKAAAEWSAGKKKIDAIKKKMEIEEREAATKKAWDNKLGFRLFCGDERNNGYCDSQGGVCVEGECKRSSQTIDPDGSPCTYNLNCNNKDYEGLCMAGTLCRSVARARCSEPGRVVQCISIDGSRTGGTAVCGNDGRVGDCLYTLESHKASLGHLNDNNSAWNSRKVRPRNISYSVDPSGSPCSKADECNTNQYEGYCANLMCETLRRASCGTAGSMALCFAMDGSRTAGIAVCGNNGKRNDCVSRRGFHEEYHKLLDVYAEKGIAWDKLLSGRGPSKMSIDPTGSPCTNHVLCTNQNYEGSCSFSHGECSAVKREDCYHRGRTEICVTQLGKLGLRMCQPKGLSALRWGDCFPQEQLEQDIRDLKQQKKWESWGGE